MHTMCCGCAQTGLCGHSEAAEAATAPAARVVVRAPMHPSLPQSEDSQHTPSQGAVVPPLLCAHAELRTWARRGTADQGILFGAVGVPALMIALNAATGACGVAQDKHTTK